MSLREAYAQDAFQLEQSQLIRFVMNTNHADCGSTTDVNF
jgi:hypothetical protein